jgi:hypothetical protein
MLPKPKRDPRILPKPDPRVDPRKVPFSPGRFPKPDKRTPRKPQDPRRSPRDVPDPGPSQDPQPEPKRVPQWDVRPGTPPKPSPGPKPSKRTTPKRNPLLFPFFVGAPGLSLAPAPALNLQPDYLTDFDPVGVGSGLRFTDPSPSQPEQRRCKEQKKKARRVCYEGFLRQRENSEKFTRWQRIDCRTGKDI